MLTEIKIPDAYVHLYPVKTVQALADNACNLLKFEDFNDFVSEFTQQMRLLFANEMKEVSVPTKMLPADFWRAKQSGRSTQEVEHIARQETGYPTSSVHQARKDIATNYLSHLSVFFSSARQILSGIIGNGWGNVCCFGN